LIHSEQYRDPESMGSKVEYGAERDTSADELDQSSGYGSGHDPGAGPGQYGERSVGASGGYGREHAGSEFAGSGRYGAEDHPSQGTAEYSTGEDPSPGYGGRQTEPGAYQTEDDPSHGAGGYSTGQDPSGSSGGTAARVTGHPDSTTGSDAGGNWEDR
jgi:hypothetical protein